MGIHSPGPLSAQALHPALRSIPDSPALLCPRYVKFLAGSGLLWGVGSSKLSQMPHTFLCAALQIIALCPGAQAGGGRVCPFPWVCSCCSYTHRTLEKLNRASIERLYSRQGCSPTHRSLLDFHAEDPTVAAVTDSPWHVRTFFCKSLTECASEQEQKQGAEISKLVQSRRVRGMGGSPGLPSPTRSPRWNTLFLPNPSQPLAHPASA